MIPQLTKDSLIVRRLLLKRDLLGAGDPRHEEIKPALIIIGGAMRGVYGAGAVQAFHELGLSDVFDNIIGISTGAAIGSYFLAGKEQTLIGSSIYYEECVRKEFINFTRFRRVMNIDYLATVMREGTKALDQQAVIRARSHMYYGVTNVQTGKFELIAEREARPDVVQAIMASAALPVAYHKFIEVNSRQYIDGGVSLQFPFRYVTARFAPTDVVVITNHPARYLTPPFSQDSLAQIASMLFRKHPHLRSVIRQRQRSLIEELQATRSVAGIQVASISAPEDTVRDFTVRPDVLRKAMDRAREETKKVFL